MPRRARYWAGGSPPSVIGTMMPCSGVVWGRGRGTAPRCRGPGRGAPAARRGECRTMAAARKPPRAVLISVGAAVGAPTLLTAVLLHLGGGQPRDYVFLYLGVVAALG